MRIFTCRQFSLFIDSVLANSSTCSNLSVTPKPVLMTLSQSFVGSCRIAENLSHLTRTFPAEGEQGDALPSCFGSHTVLRCPLRGLFSAMFFTFLYLFSVIWLF